MSLMSDLQRRSTLLSFLEIGVFFFLITPLYFILPVYVGSWISGAVAIPHASFFNLIAWVGSLPIWLALIVGGGYIVLIIVYWLPGEAVMNDTEVRAFTWFALSVLVLAGVLLEKYAGFMSQMVKNFTE